MRRLIVHIAEDDRRLLQPARLPQRFQIGREMEIAVATLPIGEAITGDGLHLHVGGQEIIAGVRALSRGLGDKVLGVQSLAQQPAIMIAEGEDHRVDLVGGDPPR